MFAKVMFGDMGIKRIGRQIGFTLAEFKVLVGHNDVNEALFGADAAVTGNDFTQVVLQTEAHSTAVTAAIAPLFVVHATLP